MRETLVDVSRSPGQTDSVAPEFYARYDWCLNPVLSLRELFIRLREELDRGGDLPAGWRREESRVNLYLFVCAIACTVDDYLAWRPWNLAALAGRSPRARSLAGPAQSLLNVPWSVRGLIADRGIARWRQRWDGCVEYVCEMLVRQEAAPAEEGSDARRWSALRTMVRALAGARLPDRLLRQRMRLPEGFRCHDLTHHDVFSLARRFADRRQGPERGLTIIGPRTAGAYLAPLVKAYLSAQGWRGVSWMTIRPKTGLSRREWRGLRRAARSGASFLLVDDYPNTGTTFGLMLGLLARLGVAPERITVAAPRHPAEPDEPLLKGAAASRAAAVVRLEPGELFKARLLDPAAAGALIRECYPGWNDVRIEERPAVDAVNARLWAHYPDGFQARLKRLFSVRLGAANGESAVRHVVLKSVGWGWLGYHAYIIGTRMSECVPAVVGLRDGLLLTEWAGDPGRVQAGLPGSDRVRVLASYVAKRVQRLRLGEDPCFDSPGYRWNGWDEMVTLLRGAYGRRIGRLKHRALREGLRRYVSPVPAVVDGRMRPDEWIETPAGARKVDFEQHNFGGAEKDLVDPAWDLASAIFEFALSPQEERDLLQAYARESGDHTIFDRILLYQLLCGAHHMQYARARLARARAGPEREHWNRRYLHARNFSVYRMSRGLCESLRRQTKWTRRLFFLDLDGVFDCERLGFPHTTPSGLAALDLLRSRDVSAVLMTGRSVEHVRDYCAVYGLPGGIAEYGSVFVDAAGGAERPLIDPQGAEQLARCREAIKGMPEVCVDEGYRYSVRAYRWRGADTAGLGADEAQAFLARCGYDRLAAITRAEDTYIVQKGISKGSALRAVKEYLGCPREPAAAMGDSEQDLDALELAEWSYAPANCAPAVRELARRGRCRVMRQPWQRGLLAAARDMVAQGAAPGAGIPAPRPDEDADDLLRALSRVSERSPLRQFLAVLDRRRL